MIDQDEYDWDHYKLSSRNSQFSWFQTVNISTSAADPTSSVPGQHHRLLLWSGQCHWGTQEVVGKLLLKSHASAEVFLRGRNTDFNTDWMLNSDFDLDLELDNCQAPGPGPGQSPISLS